MFGRIDILVNNAGINRDVTMRKMTDEAFTEVIEINLTGTHRVTKAVVDPMCEAGFGRIVTVSSFVGELGNFGQSNYAATKGGLIAWTKTVALRGGPLRRHGQLRLPGVHRHRHAGAACSDESGSGCSGAHAARPVRQADEVARAVVLVASEGDYMTGSCLDINGGIFM